MALMQRRRLKAPDGGMRCPAFASQAGAEGFSALHSASSWRNSTSKIYRRDAILGMIAELEFAC